MNNQNMSNINGKDAISTAGCIITNNINQDLLQNFINNGICEEKELNSWEKYEIRNLNEDDLCSLIELQAKILKGLPDDQTFIYEKTDDEILNNCNYKSGITVGAIKKNGELIWQAVVLFDYTDTAPPINNDLKKINYIWWTATLVNKEYRKNGVMWNLVKVRDEIIESLWKEWFAFPIDASNRDSYSVVLQSGYLLTNAFVDPVDGWKTYSFHHPLKINPSYKNDVIIRSNDFDEISNKLLPEGYVWVWIDWNDILFRETTETN